MVSYIAIYDAAQLSSENSDEDNNYARTGATGAVFRIQYTGSTVPMFDVLASRDEVLVGWSCSCMCDEDVEEQFGVGWIGSHVLQQMRWCHNFDLHNGRAVRRPHLSTCYPAATATAITTETPAPFAGHTALSTPRPAPAVFDSKRNLVIFRIISN